MKLHLAVWVTALIPALVIAAQAPPGAAPTNLEMAQCVAYIGDPLGYSGLGDLYYFGLGVKQDYEQAAAWYRKAADRGSAKAQDQLGLMYESGQGVPQDYKQAAVWFHKAADQGYASAQYRLGLMYEDGQGVAKSYALAYQLYSHAAAAGERQASSALAGLLSKLTAQDLSAILQAKTSSP